jgi:flagellar biosynthesis protein FlhB
MAEDDDDSQKTEDPTGKRLGEAREKGQIPISREINHWFMIGAALVMVYLLSPGIVTNLRDMLVVFLASPHSIPVTEENIQSLFLEIIGQLAMILAVLFGVFLCAAIAATMLQTGFFISYQSLDLDLSRLSPLVGLHKILSKNNLVEFLKSFVKMVIVGIVVFNLVWPSVEHFEDFINLDMSEVLDRCYFLTVKLVSGTFMIVTLIAFFDLAYQRFEYYKRLRMTKQEVKDEAKQMEGDPMIKARLRQLRLQRARNRMMASVPTADVIITNPTHFAVALKYDREKSAAPVVVAKGQDLIALKIREVATENNVPIVENPPLARALHKSVEIDQEIPASYYRAVAEIISYVYKLKKTRR